MSEVRLNLIDSQQIVIGTIHGSMADRAVAALSAEPESIAELADAMRRFIKLDPDESPFSWFRPSSDIDDRPYDAGIMIIDLAGRIVASESTYSSPGHEGSVDYHNGQHATDLKLYYRLPDDWLFVRSIAEYEGLCDERRKQRLSTPPLDARAIMYGEPLLNFIIQNVSNVRHAPNVRHALACRDSPKTQVKVDNSEHPLAPRDAHEPQPNDNSNHQIHLSAPVMDVHRRWLTTPRNDLNGQSPRDLIFWKRQLIEYDQNSREMQWEILLEEPPSLSRDSFAYRFAGFGPHEWVMYYDLVRFLIWEAVDRIMRSDSGKSAPLANDRFSPDGSLSFSPSFSSGTSATKPSETVSTVSNCEETARTNDTSIVSFDNDDEALVQHLEELKHRWLNEPKPELPPYIPAEIIDNERRRRPEAMTGRDMVIDENCPCCKMMGDESEAGLGIYFCKFDGSHMEDEFAFSSCATLEEWEEEHREREESDRKWKQEELRDRSEINDNVSDDFDIPY